MTMLEEYSKKRNFSKTPEPKPNEDNKSQSKMIYVIQRHHARKLHYDLRLEVDGILKSWAVPKEPPIEPNIKRLAVQTEDHPMDYANFEGEIPEGLYGAGKVEIWDKGHYEPKEITQDKIIFTPKGNKLTGTYCLIKTKLDAKSWLFFKKKEK